ncbi:MAG: FAD-dependent oxidoreductase, partial [Bacillota bacterium]
EGETGGQVKLAARAPYKEAYERWIRKLTTKAERAGVKFQLNTRVTPEMIAAGNPEAVILATGAEEAVPPIEGIDLPHVYFARQVIKGEVQCTGKVLVIGGGLVGMEVADFCREQGCHDLVLVEEMPESPVTKAASHGYMLHKRFRQAGYTMILGAQVRRITTDAVTISVGGQEQQLTGFDQVIVATGTKPRDGLKSFLEEKGITYQVVGDAVKGRRIIEAVEEGARAAWSI